MSGILPPPEVTNEILVSAVMPCLNEANSLGICIRKAQESFARLGISGEVVVADNGSTDGSPAIAESLGARVVHETQRGYGAALMAGIGAARGQIIIMGDADDSYDWGAIDGFIEKVRAGYDLVMGNRFLGGIEPGAMPPLHRYLGNPVLSFITRRLHGIPIGDFHCGMRAFTRKAYTRMKVRTPGMEFATEIVVNAAHAGLRIGEIPCRLHQDKRGRPPHLRSFRDGWRHLRFILTYAPDYLYMLPGGLCTLLGAVGLTILAPGPAVIAGFTFGIHFLALASLLFLTGSSLLIFGILAKTLHSVTHPAATSTFTTLLARFTLEKGLVVGLILILTGLGTDAVIFTEWLSRQGGAMTDTVHVAFVATTAVVLGLQVFFASFLLGMMLERR
ncbi:MAG: glycosyltransferase family 2 protein [Rhodocyclaceae bacterium]|nr:glycosyltransferase family 2 protein [Rhodocyclaceae bacterium]